MTTAVDQCVCEHVTAEAIQCHVHKHLFKGGRRLASVTSIIHKSFPMPAIDPLVLENARERGAEVDVLFEDYVLGRLTSYPAGMREDAKALLKKLVRWYDAQNFRKVETQVLLAGEDHGGILDFRCDGTPIELKATFNVDETHRLQAAGYCCLDGNRSGFILHVTERFPEPRLVPLTAIDIEDWQVMLANWRMIQRRLA